MPCSVRGTRTRARLVAPRRRRRRVCTKTCLRYVFIYFYVYYNNIFAFPNVYVCACARCPRTPTDTSRKYTDDTHHENRPRVSSTRPKTTSRRHRARKRVIMITRLQYIPSAGLYARGRLRVAGVLHDDNIASCRHAASSVRICRICTLFTPRRKTLRP